MAWLFAGLGVAYIYSEASDAYDKATAPIKDYFEQINKESEQRENEVMRQNSIIKLKEGVSERNQIRKQYCISSKSNTKMSTRLINNTKSYCEIIYVNFDRANNNNEAIDWSRKVLLSGFDDMLNKSNTKKEVINTSDELLLIKKEFDEYFIVVYSERKNKFIVLDKLDLQLPEINLKDKFKQKKPINDKVDMGCRLFF